MDLTPPKTTTTKPTGSATTTTPEKPALPKTLGAYLKDKKVKPEEVLSGASMAPSVQLVARALLLAAGIDRPTGSQTQQVSLEVVEALQNGKLDYEPHLKARVIPLEDNVEQLAGNIFFERDIFTDRQLDPSALKLTQQTRDEMTADFESGLAGMLLSATFIDSNRRMEGDFSRAYGKKAWEGFLAAHQFLEEIPRGQLLGKLDVEFLAQVNALAYSPDEGFGSQVKRTVNAYRRGHFEHPGRLRTTNSYYSPKVYTKDQVEQLRSLGIRLIGATKPDGSMRAFLQYPNAKGLEEKVNAAITTLKTRLMKPDVTSEEIISAIAAFHRELVALHPFEDGNGRTSRLMLNRLLSEFDFPPAIFDDPERDIVISAEAWEREVKEGMLRSKKFIQLRSYTRSQFEDLGLHPSYTTGITPPVIIDGHPFDLSTEGFLFSVEGRPSLVMDGVVTPLSQMEYYVIARRLGSMTNEEGQKALESLTAETRAAYDAYRQDPQTAPKLTRLSDDTARQADSRYVLHPQPKVGEALVDLAKVERMDPLKLWKTGQTSKLGSIMSKFSQVDLELWYVEKGLKEAKLKPLATQVHAQREKLFTQAKSALAEAGDPAKKSETNPLGLTYRFEKLMLDNSPLRFDSLQQAIRKEGDDSLVLWRGDYATVRLLGMAPNNDPRQPDAKKVAEDRYDAGGIGFVQHELGKVEGSAKGRQYISNTSDLELLTHAFSNSTKSQDLNLNPLPGWARDRVEQYVEDRMVVPEPDPNRPAYETASKTPVYEIKDRFGIPGTVVKLETQPEHKLRVTAPRKAFRVVVDKKDVIPGLRALGGSFQSEQEVHGLETVYPWDVREAYTQEQLKEKLEPQTPAKPAVTTTPVTTTPVTTTPVTTTPVTTTPVTTTAPQTSSGANV